MAKKKIIVEILSKGKQELTDIENRIKSLEASVGKLPPNIRAYTKTQMQLSDELKRNKVVIDALQTRQRMGIELSQVEQAHLAKATRRHKELTRVLGDTAFGFGKFNKSMLEIIATAAKWALVYTAVYSTIRAVINIVSDNVKTLLDLEQVLSRVATVTQFANKSQQEILNTFKEAIIAYGSRANITFKEAGDVLYYLGSAGLDVEKQLAGLKPVLDLTIGTFGDVKDTAKLVAGVYNNLGDSIKGAVTEKQKMQRISDVIARTFQREQVELNDIATAMQYVGGEAGQVQLGFEDLVGTIGFLNSHMLFGSKAGRNLARAFANMQGHMADLVAIGVKIEQDKPLNFEDVIRQLKDLNDGSALFRNALNRIFGMQGTRAITRMIDHFDKWQQSMRNAGQESEGAAETIKNLAQENVRAQQRMLRNNLAGIFDNMGFSAKDLTEKLKGLNKELNLISNIGRLDVPWFEKIGIWLRSKLPKEKTFVFDIGDAEIFEPPKRTGEARQQQEEKITEEKEKQVEIVEKQSFRERLILEALNSRAGKEEDIRHELAMRKILGQDEVTISQAKVRLAQEALDSAVDEKEVQEKSVELQRARNELAENYIQRLRDIAVTFEDMVSEGLIKIAEGAGSLADIWENIRKEMVSTQIKEWVKAFGQTDIGASIFGGLAKATMGPFERQITDASESGSRLYYNAILLASQQGAMAMAQAASGAGGNMPNLAAFSSLPAGTQKNIEAQIDEIERQVRGGGSGAGKFIQGAMGFAAFGSTLYGIHQNKPGGLGGMLGGATTGAMAGSVFGPWGTVIGAIVGGIAGAFLGMGKEESRETREQTKVIASKINVTNKQLEIVNRNLLALKATFEGFVMPESFYFQQRQRSGVAYQFELNTARGYQG